MPISKKVYRQTIRHQGVGVVLNHILGSVGERIPEHYSSRSCDKDCDIIFHLSRQIIFEYNSLSIYVTNRK